MGFQDRIQPTTQAASSEEIDLLHAARITSDQVGAIATWLDYNKVLAETREFVGRMSKPKKLSPEELKQVRLWLINAWSTESLLSKIETSFSTDACAFAVHWAFPQAYYAVFALRQAWTKVLRYGDDKHQTVIRRFGDDAVNGRLPLSLSPCVSGIDGAFVHHAIEGVDFNTDRRLIRTDVHSIAGYVGSALRSTRRSGLKIWRNDHSKEFRTKTGQRKKKLTSDDWLFCDNRLGPTSIVSYLYRKRTKANYDDIDAFHNDAINATVLIRDINSILRSMFVVHEVMICNAVGKSAYYSIQEGVQESIGAGCRSRTHDVMSCIP